MDSMDFSMDWDSFGGELDFDINDFDVVDEPDGIRAMTVERPRFHVPQRVAYEYARDFAASLDLREGMSTFAIVSGNFIFGDFLEALVELGRLSVKELTIQTLSMSQDNVDSIRNILEMEQVDRLTSFRSDE